MTSAMGLVRPFALFVGRGLELARLRAFVLGARNGAVCAIEGPAGCGKTALLDELWRVLPSLGVERAWLDRTDRTGRTDRRAAAAPPESLLMAFEPPEGTPGVVICDGWDELARDLTELFPRGPEPTRDVVYIVAGRAPVAAPPPDRLCVRIALDPLSPHEIDSWLARFGFPPRARALLASRTYGDPLALALAIDVAALSGSLVMPGPGEVAAEVLSAHLLSACHHSTTRLALFALALASPLDAAGLARALGVADPSDMIRWLEQLAVVRRTPTGLALQRTVASYLLRGAGPTDRHLVRFVAERVADFRATGS